MGKARAARLAVLAGANGAGKSSVIGGALRAEGLTFFNPDAAVQAVLHSAPQLTIEQATRLAVREGVRLLKHAVDARQDYAFETTLSGAGVTQHLYLAAQRGMDVIVWFVGLASPELHLERIAARVARGGHDVAESDVRRRFDRSRANLIRVLRYVAEAWVYDNSATVAFGRQPPRPQLMLHWKAGRVLATAGLTQTADWAKPIVMAALGGRSQ